MHTNSLIYSRELGTRAGELEYMSEMFVVHPHRSNQIQIIVRTQAHSDLMPDNAGATQATVIVLWETLLVC